MIPIAKAVVASTLAVGAMVAGGSAMAYADPYDWAHDHAHPHPGWRFFGGRGWYPGFVSVRDCFAGGGHPDFRRAECEGGRFDDFLLR